MHCYETLYIIHPEAGEGGDTAKAEVEKRITDNGGRIYYRENWGNKRLAYDIAKQSKGNYQLIHYVASPEALSEMERLFRLDESYLKFLTIRLKEDPATAGANAGAGETEAKADDEKAETKAGDKAGGKADEKAEEPAAAATGE
jgi:small subunit ribosomal protein S6